MIEKIRKLNGLRKVLVHRYNHIDNNLINQEKDHITTDIKTIIKQIEAIIREI